MILFYEGGSKRTSQSIYLIFEHNQWLDKYREFPQYGQKKILQSTCSKLYIFNSDQKFLPNVSTIEIVKGFC